MKSRRGNYACQKLTYDLRYLSTHVRFYGIAQVIVADQKAAMAKKMYRNKFEIAAAFERVFLRFKCWISNTAMQY